MNSQVTCHGCGCRNTGVVRGDATFCVQCLRLLDLPLPNVRLDQLRRAMTYVSQQQEEEQQQEEGEALKMDPCVVWIRLCHLYEFFGVK